MLTTTETTFLGNLQLPFSVRGGVYNTPRCLCCRHIKCKVVKFGVVSCCLCCRFIFTRLQNSSVTTLPLGKSPITGENAYKNINFRPLSRYFPWFGHHVLAFSTLKCPSRRSSKSFTPNWASKATRLPHAQACKDRDGRGSARASLHQRRRNHRSRYARRFLREPREGIIAVYLITQQKKGCVIIGAPFFMSLILTDKQFLQNLLHRGKQYWRSKRKQNKHAEHQ